jgi:hypothetical protein
MADKETTLEMRGMRRKELMRYFAELGGEEREHGQWTGTGWEVEIGEETFVTIGSLRIPSTMVSFRCGGEVLEQMVGAFRLKFLSAGG